MKLFNRKPEAAPANPFDLTYSAAPPPAEDDAYWQPGGGIGFRHEDEAEAVRVEHLEQAARNREETRTAPPLDGFDHRPADFGPAANL